MKRFFQPAILILAAALATASCNKKEPAQQIKSNGLPKAQTEVNAANTVAIVDIDTLASQYEYCKEGMSALKAKQTGYEKQLHAKGQALQNAMIDFQKKAQSGAFTSQQQGEAAQAKLQKQQQQLQNFQMQIEGEMAKATQQYQQVLRDSLDNFLKEFNRDGRYKLILSRSGDNVLYADPAVDITKEVVAGLNKRYKKAK